MQLTFNLYFYITWGKSKHALLYIPYILSLPLHINWNIHIVLLNICMHAYNELTMVQVCALFLRARAFYSNGLFISIKHTSASILLTGSTGFRGGGNRGGCPGPTAGGPAVFIMIFMFYGLVKQKKVRQRIVVRTKWSIKTSLTRNARRTPPPPPPPTRIWAIARPPPPLPLIFGLGPNEG